MLKRLLLLMVILLLGALGWTWSEWHRPYRGYEGSVIVNIQPGTSTRKVAHLLAEYGVIEYRWPFLLRHFLSRNRHLLKAGEYFFDRPLAPLEVYRKLAAGDIYLHTVVVPEGSDRFDIARILQQQMGIDPAEFLRASQQTAALQDLAPQAPTLEGYLFPDTYRFPRHVSAATAAATMLARFRQVYATQWLPSIPSPLELHDVVTLASLVEKETSEPHERPIVAGVYLRRLEKGWALQCDPTVMYAIRLKYRLMGRSTVPLMRDDLKIDSRYNTYRNSGLPPGPIASPGRASIEAVLHPAAGDALYFVSNNQGGHAFAPNLAEHNRNVAAYRRLRAAARQAAASPAAEPGGAGTEKAGKSPAPTAKSAEPKH